MAIDATTDLLVTQWALQEICVESYRHTWMFWKNISLHLWNIWRLTEPLMMQKEYGYDT